MHSYTPEDFSHILNLLLLAAASTLSAYALISLLAVVGGGTLRLVLWAVAPLRQVDTWPCFYPALNLFQDLHSICNLHESAMLTRERFQMLSF